MSEGREGGSPRGVCEQRVMMGMGVEQWPQLSVGACLAFPSSLPPSLPPFVFNGACYVAMLFALASSSSASIIAVELSFTFGRAVQRSHERPHCETRYPQDLSSHS